MQPDAVDIAGVGRIGRFRKRAAFGFAEPSRPARAAQRAEEERAAPIVLEVVDAGEARPPQPGDQAGPNQDLRPARPPVRPDLVEPRRAPRQSGERRSGQQSDPCAAMIGADSGKSIEALDEIAERAELDNEDGVSSPCKRHEVLASPRPWP